MKELCLNDLDATAKLAQALVKCITPGQTVALLGDLGAGKTTFCSLICKHFSITAQVSSPTYVLEHLYSNAGGLIVEHWDVYRCREIPPELLEPIDKQNIRFVEWADKFPDFLKSCDWRLTFELQPDLAHNCSRKVRVECVSSQAQSNFESICKSLSL